MTKTHYALFQSRTVIQNKSCVLLSCLPLIHNQDKIPRGVIPTDSMTFMMDLKCKKEQFDGFNWCRHELGTFNFPKDTPESDRTHVSWRVSHCLCNRWFHVLPHQIGLPYLPLTWQLRFSHAALNKNFVTSWRLKISRRYVLCTTKLLFNISYLWTFSWNVWKTLNNQTCWQVWKYSTIWIEMNFTRCSLILELFWHRSEVLKSFLWIGLQTDWNASVPNQHPRHGREIFSFPLNLFWNTQINWHG